MTESQIKMLIQAVPYVLAFFAIVMIFSIAVFANNIASHTAFKEKRKLRRMIEERGGSWSFVEELAYRYRFNENKVGQILVKLMWSGVTLETATRVMTSFAYSIHYTAGDFEDFHTSCMCIAQMTAKGVLMREELIMLKVHVPMIGYYHQKYVTESDQPHVYIANLLRYLEAENAPMKIPEWVDIVPGKTQFFNGKNQVRQHDGFRHYRWEELD